MAGPTVFEDVADEFALDSVGQLFTGSKFWVAQRVPGRVKLLDDIKANGGEVVLLEKKADYRIADRFRKDCPPGTISYEFVTKSIADGRLHDPEDHPAGPPEGEARAPGDLNRPGKGTRTAYTPEEDIICYKWVRESMAGGGMPSGNEIYKQLEAKVCASIANLRLWVDGDSIRDTRGNHGVIATSSNYEIGRLLPSTYPTMLHRPHPQTTQQNRHGKLRRRLD
jgi:hypothetical protein